MDGPGAPDRLMLISGPWGSGKTVMLIELASLACERHWQVVSETASEGLCERLIARIAPSPSHLTGVQLKPSFMGVSLGQLDIAPAMRPSTLRDAMHERLKGLGPHKGLLITIDEIQDADQSDLTAIATAVQHLLGENANIAVVFAGLPDVISDLLNAKVVTFLRRASIKRVGDVPLDEVREALAHTIRGQGVRIADETLDAAAQASGGYPYMIQLVGFWMWRIARRRTQGPSNTITMEDFQQGLIQAKAQLGEGVCAPVVGRLSERAREYLKAMSCDDGPSDTSQIADRMGQSMDYANQYRSMLIDQDVIIAPERGKVDFAVPYLREYLRAMESNAV